MNDESILIKKAKRGDKPSLEKLYESNFNTLFRFVRFKINTIEEAEDITAEAFIRAFEALKNFKEKSCFKTYVYAIAKNLIFESYKKHKSVSLDEEKISNIQPNQVNDKEVKEKIKIELNEILNNLNETEREVIELRYISSFSIKQTAEYLNLSEANIKIITHRALKKCQKFTSHE